MAIGWWAGEGGPVSDPRSHLYHNLSVLTAAGVPIGRALHTAAPQGRFGRLFRALAEDISRACTLTEAVEHRRRHFNPLEVALIRVGEDTGQLDEVFRMLAEWYGFRHRLHRTITSGLILPLLLIHAASVLAPLPQLVLGGWDVAAYARAVVGFLAGFYVPAAVVLGIVCLTPRRGPLRAVLDALVLWVPVLGGAVRDLALSRYSQAFGMALKAGLPIAQAATLAEDAAGNAVVRSALRGGGEAIRQGREMSSGFLRRLLPSEFIAVWEVGEEAGALDDSAVRLGGVYGDRAEEGLRAVCVWVPRLIYLAVVLVLANSVLAGFARVHRVSVGFP